MSSPSSSSSHQDPPSSDPLRSSSPARSESREPTLEPTPSPSPPPAPLPPPPLPAVATPQSSRSLRRHPSSSKAFRPRRSLGEPPEVEPEPPPLCLIDEYEKRNDVDKEALLLSIHRERWACTPYKHQIEATMHALEGRNTFVSVATSGGKTRIAELFATVLPDPIIVVVVPTSALGRQQVANKLEARFSAVFLEKEDNWKHKSWKHNRRLHFELVNGKYQFIYLSPEILTTGPFADVIKHPTFAARRKMGVLDEAYYVYAWGLYLENKKNQGADKEKSSSIPDLGSQPFRPKYGELQERFGHLGGPILLLTGTCTPQARSLILRSLRLEEEHVVVVRGDPFRPEVRIVRSLSLDNLQEPTFADQLLVGRTNPLPTSLIYCRTRLGCGYASSSFHKSTVPPTLCNDTSTLSRPYHSVTSEVQKLINVADFEAKKFPVFFATSALGAGLDWIIRCVFCLGSMDPADAFQLGGRAGRDGLEALVLLAIEKSRHANVWKRWEEVKTWEEGRLMGPDDAAVALAHTVVCLPVVASLYFETGSIPRDPSANLVSQEFARQQNIREGNSKVRDACRCSNCDVDGAEELLKNLGKVTNASILGIPEPPSPPSPLLPPLPLPQPRPITYHSPSPARSESPECPPILLGSLRLPPPPPPPPPSQPRLRPRREPIFALLDRLHTRSPPPIDQLTPPLPPLPTPTPTSTELEDLNLKLNAVALQLIRERYPNPTFSFRPRTYFSPRMEAAITGASMDLSSSEDVDYCLGGGLDGLASVLWDVVFVWQSKVWEKARNHAALLREEALREEVERRKEVEKMERERLRAENADARAKEKRKLVREQKKRDRIPTPEPPVCQSVRGEGKRTVIHTPHYAPPQKKRKPFDNLTNETTS